MKLLAFLTVVVAFSAAAQDEAVTIEQANGVCACNPFWHDNSLRGVLYREGFIDDHERPIEPILTPLKAAIAKCEGLHRASGEPKQ